QNTHSFHSLIVCGFSEDDKYTYIIDSYTQWKYQGKVLTKILDKARVTENNGEGLLASIQPNASSVELKKDNWREDKNVLFKNLF
ncbi:hypothetical protein OFB62_31055, partial [Escherichia coli]|nr:hypothetical protein [Escherichia coli]